MGAYRHFADHGGARRRGRDVRARAGMGRRCIPPRLGCAERIEDRPPGDERPPVYRPIHHVPGGRLRRRRIEDARRNLREAVVLGEVRPVPIGDAPARVPMLLEVLKALSLLLLGEVKPQFDQHHSFFVKEPLETPNFVDLLGELLLPDAPERAPQDRHRVPISEENRDFALRRERAPKTPERGALGFFRRRLYKGFGAQMARVHPFGQEIYGLPFSGTVDAIDQDDDRRVLPIEELVLGIEKVGPQFGNLCLVGGRIERFPFQEIEHAREPTTPFHQAHMSGRNPLASGTCWTARSFPCMLQ